MGNTDPSCSTVGADAEWSLHQEDQDHRHHISQHSEPFPEMIRDISNNDHSHQTDDIGNQLFLHIKGCISMGIISLIGAGGIDHDQTKSQ